MRYAQIVFSPTGGTAKAADILTENWQDVEKIDLTKAETDFSEYTLYTFSSEDTVLVAMPSFGGLAPQTAIDRFLRISGNGAKCIVVAVYGNRAFEDTLVQMQDAAEQRRFHVIAGVSAIAEHSILRQYAAGRPNQSDIAQLSAFADRIAKKCAADKTGEKIILPGNRPYKKGGGAGLVPKCTSSCVLCGECAKVCPTQAIDRKNPKGTDRKKCISCMRCVSVCTKNARKVSSVMTAVAALAIKKACSEKKENTLFI